LISWGVIPGKGERNYTVIIKGRSIGAFGIALYPIEFFKPSFPVSLGLRGGISIPSWSDIPVYTISGILYKRLNLDNQFTFTPEIVIAHSMRNINHVNYSNTSVMYGFALGINLFNNSYVGTKYNRFMILAIEFATGKVDNDRIYSVGMGLIVRIWDPNDDPDSGEDFL